MTIIVNTTFIKQSLTENYDIDILDIKLLREGGNLAYHIQGADKAFFLKVVRLPFTNTFLSSVDIHLYLAKNHFPVMPIVQTKSNAGYVQVIENHEKLFLIVYDYVEGDEPSPDKIQEAGALVGRLHRAMISYPGKLELHDKHFFIDRYIHIMREKRYRKAEAFREYGDELWDRVKNLPRGYCHGDLYRGNIHQDQAGVLRVLDFDTSCNGFPIYDIALFCNDTNYFDFEYAGYEKTKIRLEQFLKGYKLYHTLSEEEVAAIYDLIAVYHFQLQATIIEIHGIDCVTPEFLDHQYEWLLLWKAQCEANK